MFTEKNKKQSQSPCMCSHVGPVKLVLIEYKVVLMTVDNVLNMDVAAKKPQIIKPILDASQTSSTQTQRRYIQSAQ